jgi:hypothetical protein
MAWASGGFRSTFIDSHNATIVLNLDLETHKVALYNATPAFATWQDDTSAHNAYNGSGGQWVTANEITGTGIAAGGVLLTSTTVTGVAGGIMMWDAADTSWTTATGSAINGCLIYADAMTTPVADQGICAVSFGGAFQVTAGTFTIQWSANGIMQVDYS